jgi:predicted PurR-regulated permease PerM
VIFVALTWLGVEHAMLFSAIVFVCCFIPVVGVVLSGVPIVGMALLQPGGSLWLAVKVIGAILATHLIEVTIIDPRVFGRMMHMHPVLILIVLAVAEHFFGIWGLILGVPVSVYIISVVMLDDEAPGVTDPPASRPASA